VIAERREIIANNNTNKLAQRGPLVLWL